MADEAFALSPISARPALPGEADYDAIREAFMETSRGRWFLGEYAKRNRNADTAMVLDAVSRIEQAMSAQRQEPARNDDQLHEALAAIRGAVEQAAGKASAAIAELAPAGKLGPIHKGARIIREISWRWREIGADGRICDLIDSQLAAIEASCAEIAQADGHAAVAEAFDLLRRKLDELADGAELAAPLDGAAATEINAAAAEENVVTAAISSAAEQPSAEPPEPAIAEAPAETGFAEPEAPMETVAAEAELVAPEPVEAAAAAETAPEPVSVTEAVSAQVDDALAVAHDQFAELPEPAGAVADEIAEDEAVLEMVAIEMAAIDDSIDEFLPEEIAAVHVTVPPLVEPVVVARAPEPQPAPRLDIAPPPPRLEVTPPPPPPRPDIAPAPRPQIVPEPAPPVAPEPSLGATIIASGILQRPKPATDPLAPIRRMSQAEKIAFFS